MEPISIAISLFAVLLGIILLGVPIAFALIATSLGGIYFFLGVDGLAIAAITVWDAITPFVLICVPLYLLLGTIFSGSGLAERLYDGVFKWSARLPGSLAVATTVSCGIFSAISGSSVATAAIFSKVSVPSMIKKGYKQSLAAGSVAVGGTLGILIPPSIPLILYGVIVEESIGELFIAGVIPGIMLVVMFSIYEVFAALRDKTMGEKETFSWKEKLQAIRGMIPFVSVMIIVIGSIYGGIATPTEAAAISVVFSLIIAMGIYRSLNLRGLYKAVKDAVATSAMILFIIVGAMLFGYLLTATYIPQTITEHVASLEISRWWILIMINILLLFLGMFLEVVSIILITAPIIVPIIIALGWNPIWFGIIMTINMEMALITPPVGLNLYVIRDALPQVPFMEILKGSLPFIVLLAIQLILVALFQDIALWLPSHMGH
ncbi:MAG: TRAP transporter large permease subunit [Deltaproteobacteria bacterium]|nr:TRAP transporter large permease subunit [Deltaproteobacteria bacterium]